MPFDATPQENHSYTMQQLLRGRANVAFGWCQGKLIDRFDDNLRVCALGGLRITKGPYTFHEDHDDIILAVIALWSVLPQGLNRHGDRVWGAYSMAEDIANYNNNPHTTQADILALYDRAISRMD